MAQASRSWAASRRVSWRSSQVGGVAGAARVLACVGCLMISALPRTPGPRKPPRRRGLVRTVARAKCFASVALLLGADRSGAPDGGKPGGSNLLKPAPAGADDEVIEDGGDDLLLAS